MSTQIVDFEQKGTVLIARPQVEFIFETETVEAIKQAIQTRLTETNSTQVAMDFSKVQTFASNFIGMLVGLKRKLGGRGGDLRLSGINERLMEIINITRLDQVFSIHDALDASVKSFAK